MTARGIARGTTWTSAYARLFGDDPTGKQIRPGHR
jgi:hypothetical protein